MRRRCPEQRPHAIANVAPENVERRARPGVAHLFLYLLDAADLDECRAPRVVRREGVPHLFGGNERYVSVSRAEYKKIVRGEGYIELQQQTLPLGEKN